MKPTEIKVQFSHNGQWCDSEVNSERQMTETEAIETAEGMTRSQGQFEYRAIKITTEILTPIQKAND